MARRDRGYLRYQRDRWVAKRYAKYLVEEPHWIWYDRFAGKLNKLSKRDPWDCGRHCEMCHYGKFNENRRQLEERAWRKIEDHAW